jgi:hypothetical protein
LPQAVERREDRLTGVVGQERDRLKQRGQVATHAAVARQHELTSTVIRQPGESRHGAESVGELVARDGREYGLADWLCDSVVEHDAAGIHERVAGGVERFAVGEAFARTLCAHAQQQLAV